MPLMYEEHIWLQRIVIFVYVSLINVDKGAVHARCILNGFLEYSAVTEKWLIFSGE